MLGKLFKHEWKSIYKVGCILLVLIAVDTFFGWLAFQSPVWSAVTGSSTHSAFSILDLMSFTTLLLYITLLIGASFGIMIYLGVHYYHSMYSDEGYLTFTLPVKKSRILLSKVLAGGLWMLIITLAIYISVAVLVGTVCSLFLSEDFWQMLWQQFCIYKWDLLEMLKSEVGIDFVLWAVILVITTLVGPFCTVMMLYGAISIGQLFSKHRVLMAIVSYVGVLIVNMILSSVVQSICSFGALSDTLPSGIFVNFYVSASSIGSLVQSILMAVLLYIAAYLINEKKLNME